MQWQNVFCSFLSSHGQVCRSCGVGETLRRSEFCPDRLCLSVLHFPCLFLYDVIHSHTNSLRTAFSIFLEINNPRTSLPIVHIPRVAVHIFLPYWGRDYAVTGVEIAQSV